MTKSYTSLDQVLDFGKFNGKTIDDMLWEEPSYLEYCVKQGIIRLSPEIERQLVDELKKGKR
jgi:hypothetical protein